MLLLAEVFRVGAQYPAGPGADAAGAGEPLRVAAGICRDLGDPAGSLRELRAAGRALDRPGGAEHTGREALPRPAAALDRERALTGVAIDRELALTELEGGRLDLAADRLDRAWTELLRLGSYLLRVPSVLEVVIRQDRARLSLLQGHPSLVACELLAQSLRRAGTDQDVESLDLVMEASETLVDTMRAYFEQLETPGAGLPDTYHQLRARQLVSVAAIDEAVLTYRRGRADRRPHRLAAALDVSGMLLAARGRRPEALRALAEAAELHERVHGRDHPAWGENRWRLGRVLAAAGEDDRARGLLVEARTVLAARLGPDHPRLVRIDAALAGLGPGRDDENG
ncbi:tetratricopeptide repeat protein [Kitasatospora sp. NPDC091207]|uniref:tetratricopeptide repeat protein n=1 Tax=Kitasatospora sp. NPDC091207 TaxID=3364083 RepID=UPI003827CD5C